MKESEAVRITARLNALFPRDALEPSAAAAFANELTYLVNPELGMEVAQVCARELDRFPTLHEFRSFYSSLSRRSTPALPEPEIDPAEREEVGKLIERALHRMEMPSEHEAGGIEVTELGEGDCADCKRHGNTWTFGESRRPLCSPCIRSRLRSATAAAS